MIQITITFCPNCGCLIALVYVAQQRLKQRCHGKIEGWVDTQCSRRKELFPPVMKSSSRLCTDQCHWTTVSNIRDEHVEASGVNDRILIYDRGYARLSSKTKKALSSILGTKSSHIHFDHVHKCSVLAEHL